MDIILNTAYSFKQIGNRKNQEDARFPDEDVADGTCFVVCDGVGGNKAGEVASNIVCNSIGCNIEEIVTKQAFNNELLSRVLAGAYDDLRSAVNKELYGMATTMALIVFSANGVTMSHIGDSRIYQFRKGEGILYKSTDHSIVQELVSIGKITEEEARCHPQNNIITRSMSANAAERCPATTCSTLDVKAGDIFFLCTDGVLSEVTDSELENILLDETSDEAKMRKLSEICANSNDNNTAYMVSVAKIIGDVDVACTLMPIVEMDVLPEENRGMIDKVRSLLNRIIL